MDGVEVCFMFNCGSTVSLHWKDVWDNVGGELQLSPWTGPRIVGVEGTPLEVQLLAVAVLRAQSILGLDFLESH